ELPSAKDREPNDDAKHGTPVSGAFTASGDLQGSDDYLTWTVSDADAGQRWQVSIQSEIEANVTLGLQKPSGDELVRTYLGNDGRGEFRDLALSAGTYIIHVGYASQTPLPWILTTAPETDPIADPEPDNDKATAVPLDPATRVATGRLAADGDVDDYLLH